MNAAAETPPGESPYGLDAAGARSERHIAAHYAEVLADHDALTQFRLIDVERRLVAARQALRHGTSDDGLLAALTEQQRAIDVEAARRRAHIQAWQRYTLEEFRRQRRRRSNTASVPSPPARPDRA